MAPDAKVVKAFNTASGLSIEKLHLKIGNSTVTGLYRGVLYPAKKMGADRVKKKGRSSFEVTKRQNRHFP
jgi:hypothetical protein